MAQRRQPSSRPSGGSRKGCGTPERKTGIASPRSPFVFPPSVAGIHSRSSREVCPGVIHRPVSRHRDGPTLLRTTTWLLCLVARQHSLLRLLPLQGFLVQDLELHAAVL